MYIKNKYRKNFDKSLLNITKKLAIFYISLLSVSSYAADFIITEGETYNSKQELVGNEVGVIEAGGTLDVTGDYSKFALDFTATDNQFTNNGNFTYHNVDMVGDNNIFTNNGQMSSDGSDESEIFLITGNNNKFVNNGDIYHSRGDKNSIVDFSFIGGKNNEFINNGTIIKENTQLALFRLDGEDSNNIVNNGEIYLNYNLTVPSWYNSAYFLVDWSNNKNSNNNIFTNNNLIEVKDGLQGSPTVIYSDLGTYEGSNNNIINNYGTLSASSEQFYAIVVELNYYNNTAANNIINNYGNILSYAQGKRNRFVVKSIGIRVWANVLGNKTNNYGDILAEASNSEAIGIYSDNLDTNTSYTPYSYEVYNEGSITANSDNGKAYGLKGDILADNYGTIAANSVTNKAYGVWHESISNSTPQITNSLNGFISASSTEADAYAIHNESSDLAYQIDNYGTIIANSKNGNAYAISGNAIINNYGIITANSENGAEYVFYSPDNDNTISTGNQISTSSNQSAGHGQIINLYPGSQIVGKMNLSSNDVINLYLESDIALNVTIEGDPEINIVNNNSNIILTDNGFSTNDVDIEDLLRKNLLDSNQQITDIIKQNIIYQRVNNYKDHHLWANLIKYDLEHEKYDNIAAYTNEAHGLVLGVDFEQKKSRQSFFIALLDKHSESDKHSPPFKLDAQLISLGGYFNFSLGNFALTNALTVAYQLNKTERNIIDNINGAEVAKAKFNSIQLTPQVNLAYYHDFYNFTFIPNLNLTYSKEFYESYSETGTSNANRNFGKRDIDYYSLDLAVSVNKKILNNKADVQIKFGRQHNYFKADEVEIKYSASTGTGSLPKHNYMSNYFTTAFNYQISKDLDLNLELTHKKKLNSRLNLSLRF